MYSVEQIRSQIAPFTLDAGKCRDSKYVLEYINDARALLWPRGKFSGIMSTLCIQSECRMISLPPDYMVITDARRCGSSVAIDNEWYEHADNVKFDESCYGGMTDLGDSFATFRDYEFGVHRLRFLAEDAADKGKKIVFNAIGENGDRLSLTGVLGDDHVRVELNPWIKYFRHASKEPTVGRVRIYIHDPNRGKEKICAIYEPDDIAPQYRRYRVPVSAKRNGLYYVRAKRRYRPLLRETDPVEFDTNSIIQACIALTARRNKKNDEFTAALNLAVEHENKVLGDENLSAGWRIRLSRGRRNSNILPAV